MSTVFDQEFIERRMRQHREWQEQEADCLAEELAEFASTIADHSEEAKVLLARRAAIA